MQDLPAQNAPQHERRSRALARFRWVIAPMAIFLLSRVAIFGIADLSLRLNPHLQAHQDPIGSSNLAIRGLCRWDGGWFVRIASQGYAQPVDSNFFPLFPLLGRYISRMSGLSIAASLVLCANVCSLAALIVVYRIFLDLEKSAPIANAATALLVAWPFSFFQAAAYPESIMMLSTAAAIYLAMRQRHFAAGTVLGAGILARHLTALAGLSLLGQQIQERGVHPRRLVLHKNFLALLLPLAIASIYFAFLARRFGNWWVWIDVRQKWGTSSTWGVFDLLTNPAVVFRPEIITYVILSIIPTIGTAMLLKRRRWQVLAWFGVGQTLLLWAVGLAGLGRYFGSCWCAFLPLGMFLVRRRRLLIFTLCAFALLQAVMLYLFVHLYPIM